MTRIGRHLVDLVKRPLAVENVVCLMTVAMGIIGLLTMKVVKSIIKIPIQD